LIQISRRLVTAQPADLQEGWSNSSEIKNRAMAGFSLVEVMVAMVIGLLGMIVMMQVYSTFEAQKRTTAGGDDAQNAGAIALYGLQRDIQQSGWGISNFNVIGCNVTLPASGATAARTLAMAPATINSASITGQDANTDTLIIFSGRGNGAQEGDTVTASDPVGGQYGINYYAVASIGEFKVDDRVIAQTVTRPTPCNLALDKVTGSSTGSSLVTVVNGLANMTNGTLYNLGQTQRISAYAIRSGNLTQCDYSANDCGSAANNGNAAIWVPIANNIVSMQAIYGHDTTASPTTPNYTVTTGDKTTPTTACGWLRTPVIGMVLVARNSQQIQVNATPNPLTWGQGEGGPFTIDLSANVNWRNYRYKVFETIVPIRNIAVKGVQSGC
jgi:type IV pilus assembly protein PilW